MNRSLALTTWGALACVLGGCSAMFQADELSAQFDVIADAPVGPLVWREHKCLDARGCGGTEGQLQLCDCDADAEDQRWILANDDTLRLRGQCVAALVPQSESGSRLQLVDCASAVSPHWVALGDRLVNVEEGKCLDVHGGSAEDGTAAQLWDCRDPNENQQWRIPTHGAISHVLGQNTFVFDAATPRAKLQNRVSAVYAMQRTNLFGANRYALLFEPGSYEVDIKLGFHTQVAGLGRLPGAAILRGSLTVERIGPVVEASGTFWRAAENLTVEPNETSLLWAAARGTSYRRMHMRGGLQIDDGDQASGGFIADSVIDGTVRVRVQQQWLTRNSHWREWTGGGRSMVFVGNDSAPPDHEAVTKLDATPLIREKPFLFVNDAHELRVFVPELRRDSVGPSWLAEDRGQQVLLADFAVLTPSQSADNAARINDALSSGKHILLTPGVYALEDSVRVERSDRVLLGLGLATLVSTTGAPALVVDDAADGVKIAGVMFDASVEATPLMVSIGGDSAQRDHSQNPSSLHDVYFRVGGREPTDVGTSLAIHSSHVILDNVWAWRADRGPVEGNGKLGWEVNRGEHGIIVTGNEVTAYGLSVEHFQKQQTTWSGDRGRVFLYMSEFPPDVREDSAWMDNGRVGYATYTVDEAVAQHTALGMAVYCFSREAHPYTIDRAIHTPEHDGIELSIVAVPFDEKCKIRHVLNDRSEDATVRGQATRLTSP